MGHRAILFDAALVGFSRRLMLEAIGPGPMRELLLRLGFVQGWRAASGLADADTSLTPERLAETVQGLLTAMGIAHAMPTPGNAAFDWTMTLDESCEVDEHLRHCGPSPQPVCWLACGFASGYMSRATAHIVLCHEDACAAAGASRCRICVDARTDLPCDIAADPCSEAVSAHLIRHYERLDPAIDASPSEDERLTDGTFLGIRSPRMRILLTLAKRAAPCDSTVLITGESGVGKERLARYIHQASLRARAPLVPVNCAALPAELLENELFGHRRGAFTGALDDRPGLFEAANRGTLFLDEIGEMPLPMQAKLLRALQERQIRRLGDTREIPINVRIIAATNRDLQADVVAQRFREDLYYRLNVLTFDVPPLRLRLEDLEALADIFLLKTARDLQRPIVGYTPRAHARLMAYDWPGNVRELANAIERACALTTRTHVDLDDLPLPIRHAVTRADANRGGIRLLSDMERDHILTALRLCGGNRRRAAHALGICQDTLYRKLRKYRLPGFSDAL